MFVIIVYDVGEKRVNKVLKVARKYLYWIQNSVLEGELTIAQFEKLKTELKQIITDEDSIIFYKFRTKTYFSKEIMGCSKGEEISFL